jgi:hypothetical protein
MQQKKQKKSLEMRKRMHKIYTVSSTFIRKVFSLQATSNILAAIALLVAWNSLTISKKSLDTALGVDTFVKETNEVIKKQNELIDLYRRDLQNSERLLGKTDTVMDHTGKQLELNRIQQEITNKNNTAVEIGNMNKLASRCYQLDLFFFTAPPANLKSGIDLAACHETLKPLMLIFQDELTNPFLSKNEIAFKSWLKAYADISVFEIHYENDLQIEGAPTYNEDNKQIGFYRMDTVSLRKDFINCFKSILAAGGVVKDYTRKYRLIVYSAPK